MSYFVYDRTKVLLNSPLTQEPENIKIKLADLALKNFTHLKSYSKLI